MEFERSGEKFLCGFGSMTTAGAGNMTDAQPVPKEIKTKYDKKVIAKNAAKAAVLTAAVLVKHKVKNRKKK